MAKPILRSGCIQARSVSDEHVSAIPADTIGYDRFRLLIFQGAVRQEADPMIVDLIELFIS
ncbi:MAG: hypothetical protein KDA96_02825 [Planctomycetaceae bacterium]|nr:hypothetical protein [Planctomycetaceae bacterium]